MFGDDRKWYNLRSNTNTRTQHEPTRLQKDPPHTSNASGYVAAQYAGPGYSTPYAGPGISKSYAGPIDPPPHAAPVNSRQYTGPTNPTPYADSRYLRQSSGPAPPPQYARLGYSMRNDPADLIGPFSELKFNQRPSTQGYQPAPVSAPQRQDAIGELVQEVLTRDLKLLGNEKLLPTDPVFDLARQFARRWNISDEAVNSHIRLACGYFKFPVILLLNPAPTHEFLPFNQMVDECKTLRWIEDVLHGIGLGLRDVIILDACTLLGSDRIKQLGREGKRKKEQAMGEAYDVTQEMLRLIQPNIILSCQCSTSFPDWSAGGHPIARQLCSSIRSAKDREVKRVYLNERTVNVIQAYHPSGFLNNKGDRKAHHDTFGHLLKGVFQTIYFPCANWKIQHLTAALASSNTTKHIGASANNSIAKNTKGL